MRLSETVDEEDIKIVKEIISHKDSLCDILVYGFSVNQQTQQTNTYINFTKTKKKSLYTNKLYFGNSYPEDDLNKYNLPNRRLYYISYIKFLPAKSDNDKLVTFKLACIRITLTNSVLSS
jgi:hypothetical protein